MAEEGGRKVKAMVVVEGTGGGRWWCTDLRRFQSRGGGGWMVAGRRPRGE